MTEPVPEGVAAPAPSEPDDLVTADAEPMIESVPAASPRAPAGIGASLAAGLAIVVVDQVTKTWAEHRLSGGRIIDVLGSLRLNLTYNSGMAFSRARGFGPVIGTVGLVVVVVLLAGLRQAGSRTSSLALGLVAGGAIGNIIDRLFRSDLGFFRGEVIDFIDPQWWPVFNVADAAIVVGGLLVVLTAWWSGRRRRVAA